MEALRRNATEMYLKEQENGKSLMSRWHESTEDEIDDLIFEIDQKQQVFQFDQKNGRLNLGFSLRWETLLEEVKQVSALGLPVSSKIQKNCAKAAGISATIPTKIMRDIPFPMPRAVICSPSHIKNMVPPTSVIMHEALKYHPGSVARSPASILTANP